MAWRRNDSTMMIRANEVTETSAADTDIGDGKIKGDEISFTVTREFNGNKMVAKYSGKLSGDSIKGKIETERNGQNQSRDWEAKREK